MIVYVYDEQNDNIEKHILCLDDSMPYVTKGKLTVKAFLAKTQTKVMWTTKRFMESVDAAFDAGECLDVRVGFIRGWHEIDNGQYMHKTGTAIQGGIELSYPRRVELLKKMEDEELFDWVNELDHGPSFLHFHQNASFESDVVPFKTIQLNDKGVEVFVLQDNLWMLGYDICQLNGEYDENLEEQVKLFQHNQGLSEDGITGPNTWVALMRLIHPEDERLNAVID